MHKQKIWGHVRWFGDILYEVECGLVASRQYSRYGMVCEIMGWYGIDCCCKALMWTDGVGME